MLTAANGRRPDVAGGGLVNTNLGDSLGSQG